MRWAWPFLLVSCGAVADRPRASARGGDAGAPAPGLVLGDAAASPGGTPPRSGDAGDASLDGVDAGMNHRACLAEHYVVPESVVESDGRLKTTAERIAGPDIEDVFALRYATGAIAPVTDPEHDPGRVRIEPVLDATYGKDAAAVSAALVPVRFAGATVSFHALAAPALERVAKRLLPLVSRPATRRFFANLGGTFAYRTIAGTTRRSAHAWGIAIDLDPTACEYWRNGPQPPVWRNRVPQEIVDAFEAEGFVWGGRWFHYDTMHFEYRPELFSPRCSPRPSR